jgi:hypothetical protein
VGDDEAFDDVDQLVGRDRPVDLHGQGLPCVLVDDVGQLETPGRGCAGDASWLCASFHFGIGMLTVGGPDSGDLVSCLKCYIAREVFNHLPIENLALDSP